jgi:hypothetical protein
MRWNSTMPMAGLYEPYRESHRREGSWTGIPTSSECLADADSE